MPTYEAEVDGEKFQFEWKNRGNPTDEDVMRIYNDPKRKESNVSKFLGAAKESVVDPIVNLPSQFMHPVDTTKGMFRSTVDAVGRTREALGKGEYGNAAMSAVGALPVVGPSLEQPIREASQGNLAEATGHALGPSLAIAAPEFAGPAARLPVRAMAKVPDFMGKVGGGVTGGAVGEMAGEAIGHPYLGGYAGYKVGSELGPKALDWAKGKVAEWDKTPKRGPDEPFKPNPAVARRLGSPPSGEEDLGGFRAKKPIPRVGPEDLPLEETPKAIVTRPPSGKQDIGGFTVKKPIPRKGPDPIVQEPMKFEKSSAKPKIKRSPLGSERGSFSFAESDPEWNLRPSVKPEVKAPSEGPKVPEGIHRTTAKGLHEQGVNQAQARTLMGGQQISEPDIVKILAEMRSLGAR